VSQQDLENEKENHRVCDEALIHAKQQLAQMVSIDDVEKAIYANFHNPLWDDPDGFIKGLRARLAKPAERVTVEVFGTQSWQVKRDGWLVFGFSNLSKADAERYAAGLREELKAGKQ
jgi:hypothetical protein